MNYAYSISGDHFKSDFKEWLKSNSAVSPFSAWNTNENHYISLNRESLLNFLFSKCHLNDYYMYFSKGKEIRSYYVNYSYGGLVDRIYKPASELYEMPHAMNVPDNQKYGIKLVEAIDFLKNTHAALNSKPNYVNAYKYLIRSDLKGMHPDRIIKLIQSLTKENKNPSNNEEFDLNFIFLSPTMSFHLFLFLITEKDEELLSHENIAGIRFVRSKISKATPLLEPYQRTSLEKPITREDMEFHETVLPFSALYLFNDKDMFNVDEKICHNLIKFHVGNPSLNIPNIKKIQDSVQTLFSGFQSQKGSKTKTIVFFADYEETENTVLKTLPILDLTSIDNVRFIFDVDRQDFDFFRKLKGSPTDRFIHPNGNFFPILYQFYNKALDLKINKNNDGSVLIENIN